MNKLKYSDSEPFGNTVQDCAISYLLLKTMLLVVKFTCEIIKNKYRSI